jgi:predicted  nucleic acid-binding Zn-ribbon protein
MADDLNPFDEILSRPEPAPAPAPSPKVNPVPTENPFDQILAGPEPKAPQPVTSSAAGAFGRGAAKAAIPSVGGLAGAGLGAEIGGAAGMVAGPFGGLAGGFIGGLAGAVGGSALVDKAQSWALKQLPDSWQDALGVSEKQEQADATEHGMASFLGGLAPFALTMSPGALTTKVTGLAPNATGLERLMANPVTARLFGGAIQGGMELGNEAIEGQPLDWQKIGISTAFGLVFNKPNALGEVITHAGAGPARNLMQAGTVARGLSGDLAAGGRARPPLDNAVRTPGVEPESYPGVSYGREPTLAQAGDLRVAGPGMTEDVFLGSHNPSPLASATAQEQARTEKSILGPEPALPHVQDVARRMEPELLTAYEGLREQREQFRRWIDEQSNPSPERLEELNAQKAELEKQIAETKNRDEQRRLRTELRVGVQAELNAMAARADAFAKGEAQDTPDIAAARAHMMAVDEQMRDLAPQVAAAYRRAADALRTGAIEPHPIHEPGEAPAQEPAQEQDKNNPESVQFPEMDKNGQKSISGLQPVPGQEPNAPFRAAEAAPAALSHEAPLQANAEASLAEKQNPAPLTPAKSVAEQKQAIIADYVKRAMAAGVSEPVARANATHYANAFAVRAARFKGALGTAEELYRKEGHLIRSGKGRAPLAPVPAGEPRKPAAQFTALAERAKEAGPAKGIRAPAAPGDLVKVDQRELIAASEPFEGTQILLERPNDEGKSQAVVRKMDGTVKPLPEPVDFAKAADSIVAEQVKPAAPKPARQPAAAPGEVTLKDFQGKDLHEHDAESAARKAEFLKDGQRYLTSVTNSLTESGWEPKKNAKGKPEKPVFANKGGPAVEGDVHLSLYNPALDVNVEVQVGHGAFKQDTFLILRTGLGRKQGGNVWLDKSITAQALAAKIEAEAAAARQRVTRAPEPAPAPEPAKPEAAVSQPEILPPSEAAAPPSKLAREQMDRVYREAGALQGQAKLDYINGMLDRTKELDAGGRMAAHSVLTPADLVYIRGKLSELAESEKPAAAPEAAPAPAEKPAYGAEQHPHHRRPRRLSCASA